MSDKSIVECRSVYVVDDDESVLTSIDALLTQHGYNATCFSSAKNFLAVTDVHTCGCLIADVQMPEMNGIELLQQLIARQSTLAVIVISGVADVPTTVSAMERGAATLLEKPYEPAELLRCVDRGLAKSRERLEQFTQVQFLLTRLSSLTEEEQNVMRLMLRDKPNKAIASELGLSLRTVDRRRQTVLAKMQSDSVPELATLIAVHDVALQSESNSSIY